MRFFIIRGGMPGFGYDEEAIEAASYDLAINEAYLMACEYYDNFAGMHGIMSEQDYMDEGEAENFDEACELYRDDRESAIEYSAYELSEDEYNRYLEGEELDIPELFC